MVLLSMNLFLSEWDEKKPSNTEKLFAILPWARERYVHVYHIPKTVCYSLSPLLSYSPKMKEDISRRGHSLMAWPTMLLHATLPTSPIARGDCAPGVLQFMELHWRVYKHGHWDSKSCLVYWSSVMIRGSDTFGCTSWMVSGSVCVCVCRHACDSVWVSEC